MPLCRCPAPLQGPATQLQTGGTGSEFSALPSPLLLSSSARETLVPSGWGPSCSQGLEPCGRAGGTRPGRGPKPAPQHHPRLLSLTRNGTWAGSLDCDQDGSLQGARAAGHLAGVFARVGGGHVVQPQQRAVDLARVGRVNLAGGGGWWPSFSVAPALNLGANLSLPLLVTPGVSWLVSA